MKEYSIETGYADKSWLNITVNDGQGERIGKSTAIIVLGKFVVVEQLSVLSEFRRRGIGTKVINRIEEWGVQNNATYSIMRFAPCDFGDTFTLSKTLTKNGYKFNYLGLFYYKRLDMTVA